jgi:hypothetical protein
MMNLDRIEVLKGEEARRFLPGFMLRPELEPPSR